MYIASAEGADKENFYVLQNKTCAEITSDILISFLAPSSQNTIFGVIILNALQLLHSRGVERKKTRFRSTLILAKIDRRHRRCAH